METKREGNVMLGQEYGRFYDTAQGVKEIIHWCQSWKLKPEQVWVEYDGLNKGIVDNLNEKEWSFNKVQAGSSAIDDKRYGNRMTELWFKFKRYIEEGYVKLIPDEILKNQLSSRYYRKQIGRDKIILEPKAEAKAKGRPSPDRADACVMAWTIAPSIENFIEEHITEKRKKEKQIGRRLIGADASNQFIDDVSYGSEKFFEHDPDDLKAPIEIPSLALLEERVNKNDEYNDFLTRYI